MITREAIEKAAASGEGLAHLTPGQAWAAHSKGVDPSKLEFPLPGSIKVLLDFHSRKVEKAFRRAATTKEEMINLAYDEAYPAWLRNPLKDILSEGLRKHFPGLRPTAVDDRGSPVYSTADLAEAFGVPEEDLFDYAEREGLTDCIYNGPTNPIH